MSMILDGSNGVTFNDASLQGAAASPYVLKNRIINGDMRIDQRNAGASKATADATYTVDRWVYYSDVGSKYTVQQNAGSVTPPAGFSNYVGLTVSSAYSTLGATDYFLFGQPIEGYNIADFAWGTANAKTITLSFWVRSSLTGTFGGAIQNSAQTRSYPFSYTISSANTWEQKTITVAGCTDGVWQSTTSAGIQMFFGLGVGSTFSGTAGAWASANYFSSTGATNVTATNGATWYITGVQLEIGSTATPFERRLYNQELANCQRYYEKMGWGQSNVPGSTSGYDGDLVTGASLSSGYFTGAQYKVTKRAAPTIVTYGSIAGGVETSGIVVDANSGTSLGTATAVRITDSGYANFTATASANGAIYRATISAEL